MKRFVFLLVLLCGLLPVAKATAPVIFFTDIVSGPASGGETVSGFSGAYVTIYGNYFGSSQGGSTITLNGSNCGRVVSWGTTYFWYQKIVFQLGSSCTTGHFAITVGGISSVAISTPSINGTITDPSIFTVRTGPIFCVSTTGNDSNSGSFPSSCWATPGHAISAMESLGTGPITYVENGVSQTNMGAFSSVINLQGNPGGTAADPIALVVYPGASATIGTFDSTGTIQFAIRVPLIGNVPNYYVIAGFILRGNEAMDLSGDTGMRIIANDVSCDARSGFGCLHFDTNTSLFVYGNNVHDIGVSCALNSGNPTGSPCKYHGYYYTTNTNHVDHGWNILDTNPSGTLPATGYGIQFFSTGGSDQFDLHVHDNIFRNSASGCINFSSVNPDSGIVEAYNNVVYHCGTGPDPSGNAAGYYGVSASASANHVGSVFVYNNSLYDNGSRGNVTNTNGCFEDSTLQFFVGMKVVNNVCQSTGSSELYLTTGTGSVVCSNFSGTVNDFFGNGAPICTSNVTANLNLNPLYTSTTSGSQNLLPQSGSPVLGAGSTSMVPAYDITGRPRPSPPSMGAYELASSPAVGTITIGPITMSGVTVI